MFFEKVRTSDICYVGYIKAHTVTFIYGLLMKIQSLNVTLSSVLVAFRFILRAKDSQTFSIYHTLSVLVISS